jgi:hypothetical protein
MPRQRYDKPCSLIEIRITIFTLSGILDTFWHQHFQIRNEAKQHMDAGKKKKKVLEKAIPAHKLP